MLFLIVVKEWGGKMPLGFLRLSFAQDKPYNYVFHARYSDNQSTAHRSCRNFEFKHKILSIANAFVIPGGPKACERGHCMSKVRSISPSGPTIHSRLTRYTDVVGESRK